MRAVQQEGYFPGTGTWWRVAFRGVQGGGGGGGSSSSPWRAGQTGDERDSWMALEPMHLRNERRAERLG